MLISYATFNHFNGQKAYRGGAKRGFYLASGTESAGAGVCLAQVYIFRVDVREESSRCHATSYRTN